MKNNPKAKRNKTSFDKLLSETSFGRISSLASMASLSVNLKRETHQQVQCPNH